MHDRREPSTDTAGRHDARGSLPTSRHKRPTARPLRCLPIEHPRQTIIVSRHLILPGQLGILARACDREPHWLGWTLQRLGINGGVRTC